MSYVNSQDDLFDLLRQSARGDEQAFKLLYKNTSGRMYSVALRILRSKELAEDVMQEAYVKIWHNAKEYMSERGSVMTWMTTILRYSAIDKLRVVKKDELLDPNEDGLDNLSDEQGPSTILQKVSEGNLLKGCMDELEEKQKHSIALAFYEGLTHQQLSLHYNAPLGTVKSWVRRGLVLLRRCLRNEV